MVIIVKESMNRFRFELSVKNIVIILIKFRNQSNFRIKLLMRGWYAVDKTDQ